jgi:uncharacterized protein (TIGR03435 family)
MRHSIEQLIRDNRERAQWSRMRYLIHARTKRAKNIPGLLFIASILSAQSQGRHASFDVASVKPAAGDAPIADKSPRRSGERVFMHNSELAAIVTWAYGLHNPSYQLVAGKLERELWESYDIDATAPVTTRDEDLRLMLQSLLETRFGLKVHRETRQFQSHDLIVGRGGTRLTPAKGGPKRTMGYGGSSSWVEIGDKANRLVGKGASMEELVVILTKQMGAPVVNRTGLEGTFDYTVRFSPGLEESDVPLLVTAIRTLGLSLRKGKGKFEVLVVDQVGKLTAN